MKSGSLESEYMGILTDILKTRGKTTQIKSRVEKNSGRPPEVEVDMYSN